MVTDTTYRRAEAHDSGERHRRREERRRRELRRVRQQRAVLVVGFSLILLVVACFAAYVAFGPKPPAAKAADSGIPESDATGVMLVVADKLEGKAVKATEARIKAENTPKPLKPAPGIRTIVVNKANQTVTLYEANGAPLKRVPCSSGVYYPLVGTYKVFAKKPQSWYPADGSHFYNFTIFTKSEKGTNIGFHSVPTDSSGKVLGDLGKPVSHGCVRLSADMAKFVYDWAPMGAKVVVE
jgi:lipoprotein-anchoring transpeptidase ErfK/SrfK